MSKKRRPNKTYKQSLTKLKSKYFAIHGSNSNDSRFISDMSKIEQQRQAEQEKWKREREEFEAEKKEFEAMLQEFESSKDILEANQDLQKRCDTLEIAKQKADAKLQNTITEYENKLKVLQHKAEKAVKELRMVGQKLEAERDEYKKRYEERLAKTHAHSSNPTASDTLCASLPKTTTTTKRTASKENSPPHKKNAKTPTKRRYSMMPTSSSSKIPIRRGSSLLPSEIRDVQEQM